MSKRTEEQRILLANVSRVAKESIAPNLYTGRQGIRPFVMRPEILFYDLEERTSGVPELRKFLKEYRPRFLISSPMPGFSEEKPFTRLLKEVQDHYPGWLEAVYQGSDSRFVIYKIHPQLAPPS